ncbi:MAG: hypothetical protein AB1457_16430 [Chloroflexota bacterium]
MSKHRLIVEANKVSQDFDIYLRITREEAAQALAAMESLKEYAEKNGIHPSRLTIDIEVTGGLVDMAPSELESFTEGSADHPVYAVVEDREYWKVEKALQPDSSAVLHIGAGSVFARAGSGFEFVESENILDLIKKIANGDL